MELGPVDFMLLTIKVRESKRKERRTIKEKEIKEVRNSFIQVGGQYAARRWVKNKKGRTKMQKKQGVLFFFFLK